MKRVLILCFVMIPFLTTAQDAPPTPDDRLYVVYEKAYLDALVRNNPFLIKRWNFYLDHAYQVVDEIAGKNNDYPEIEISNPDAINILLLEKEQRLQRDWDKPMIYKIRDTEKLLVYHAGKDFTKALNEFLKVKSE